MRFFVWLALFPLLAAAKAPQTELRLGATYVYETCISFGPVGEHGFFVEPPACVPDQVSLKLASIQVEHTPEGVKTFYGFVGRRNGHTYAYRLDQAKWDRFIAENYRIAEGKDSCSAEWVDEKAVSWEKVPFMGDLYDNCLYAADGEWYAETAIFIAQKSPLPYERISGGVYPSYLVSEVLSDAPRITDISREMFELLGYTLEKNVSFTRKVTLKEIL
jgi:hypothetical protein